MKRILLSAACAFLFLPQFATAAEPTYKVLNTIKIGGEGGWDYITMDSAARRLYIARANRVIVVDVDAGKVVGEVADTPGIHGVALALKLNRGFTSNAGDSTVTAFDLKTLKEVSRIKVGSKPDPIMYDPATERVFSFNAGSMDATAIDAKTEKVVGTVKLEGRPEAGVADEKGMVYVNIVSKSEVVAFDAKDLTVKNRWPLAPGESPTGISMDRANRRLFVTCRNEKMVVLNADTGKVVTTLPIGKGTDASTFDPETKLAYSSNGDGTLTVVREDSPDKFSVVENVTTQAGAKTMALDAKTHNVLLVTAKAKAADGGKPGRRSFEPDSFVVLVVGREASEGKKQE